MPVFSLKRLETGVIFLLFRLVFLKKWIFRNDMFLLRVLWVCGILFIAIDTPLALFLW